MTTFLSGVLMLGILIFIHELGHFLVAKASGVRVLVFSLGFGPRLFGRKVNGTEYRISAVPLGGYVQMLGEGGEDDEEETVTKEDEAVSFAHKPLHRRFAIVAAGPLMNLVLPFLVLPLAYMIGVQFPAYLERQACVGYVAEETPAARAGFVAGDCLQAMNGQPLASWQMANEAMISHAGDPLVLTVLRDGQTLTLTVPVEEAGIEGLQALGLLPLRPAVVGGLVGGKPASEAGLQVGDLITRVGTVPITSWYQLRDAVEMTHGQPVEVAYVRDGVEAIVTITPVRDDDGRLLLGVAPQDVMVVKRFGLGAAIRAGADQAIDLMGMTLVFLQKLFIGSVSAKNIGGPITVFQYAGQAAKTDLSAVLTMLAFLSIQLGILNLLPIPVLDGGHLFFFALEGGLRRPLSRRTREIAQRIGLTLLIMLMVLASYNDLVRLLF